MTHGTAGDVLDRVELSIDVDATAERVWRLVSTPGWYINEGTIIEHEIIQRDGYVVVDPVHGEFPLRTVRLDPPRYAAFRWFSSDARSDDDALGNSGDEEREAPTTLVEFTIAPRPQGGVTLTVVESGFATLPLSAEARRKSFDDNTEGWAIELEAARIHLTGGGEA